MTTPNEYSLVEKPILKILEDKFGYQYIRPSEHRNLRRRENEVLLQPILVKALARLNDIPESVAQTIFQDLATIADNADFLEKVRGEYSHKIPGESQHQTITIIDLDNPSNNDFHVTNQLRVRGETTRKPDLVVFVNGIPLVVIEAKSPIGSQDAFDAISQIQSLEAEVPRLFHTNLFSIVTNDTTFLYGATGAPREFWSRWRDPWPRNDDDFRDELEKGLYALLEPRRLLDILAHFIVFETREGKTTKKVCRYQQFRAVGKMVERVTGSEHRAGLIWHTQGSGKSLTMVFAALKLKFHRGVDDPARKLQNPNLLVLTDRIDLHEQISRTFKACGLPNPIAVESIEDLKKQVVPGVVGKTLLATIFKFDWDEPRLKSKIKTEREAALRDLAVDGSENWILMVDEAHRTQEKDLGAFVRAVLPKAVRFGFTGTPVKRGDLNTFHNFGAAGERYLDKYGIDDAVRDGATVPIFYQGRMTEWYLFDKEIDVLFEQWFANEPEERLAELRQRGVTKGDLARFGPRIDLIAVDIWAHFRAHVQPDGFKAQICAIDRLACVAYKKALDRVIAKSLRTTEGLSAGEAKARAAEMSVCIYSPGQHDKKDHPELVEYQIPPERVTQLVKNEFIPADRPLSFLIVCNKLLTGFDAPIEQVMYLDNPLTDHNLLQAIARTNRRYGEKKERGIIVDYIGVSRKLEEALAAYRKEDVESAMRDLDLLADQLRAAHRAVMDEVADVPRLDDPRAYVNSVLDHLGTEDRWYDFRAKLDTFIKAYAALAPDSRVLVYQVDLKALSPVLPKGRLRFEQVEEVDWKRYSEKVRAMLDEHLEVTGLKTVCKLRSLSDPEFWDDFRNPGDIKDAAVRKLAELKKETTDRTKSNPARYEKFSDRIKELIQQFQRGLLDAEKALDAAQQLADDVVAEDEAHRGSGLSERAYGIHAILKTFHEAEGLAADTSASTYDSDHDGSQDLTALQKAAAYIDQLYESDQTAPPYWQDKSQLRKELRSKVRTRIMDLDLEGWMKKVPREVEQYALIHYRKP